MNEQLIVKNFGPIKDATVDFKRVTVFIGPTGGGKSTLAKLAAVFREKTFYDEIEIDFKNRSSFNKFLINNFFTNSSALNYSSSSSIVDYFNGKHSINLTGEKAKEAGSFFDEVNILLKKLQDSLKLNDLAIENLAERELKQHGEASRISINELIERLNNERFSNYAVPVKLEYIPAERIFVPSIEYSWAGLMRDDIGLSKTLLEFANSFSISRKTITELDIHFLGVKYLHIDGRDFIKIPERKEPLMLLEAASGIQSVTPLLVLIEHLSHNSEQAQSFIIEEPELNLYPTAQRDLVYWLLEKCTKDNNDLTITTHSPYVLSAINLALYANKVVTLFPHQRQKVANIIPEKYWLKAENFSAYYVAGGGAKSILDKKTGLLNESQLDEVSGHFADIFDRLTDLRVPQKKAPVKAKSVKK